MKPKRRPVSSSMAGPRRSSRLNGLLLGNPNSSFILTRSKSKEKGISLANLMEINRSAKPKKAKKSITGVTVTELKKKKRSDFPERVEEKNFVCEICVETKKMNEAFKIQGCNHSFCSECTVRYVASKIEENVTSIGCPETNCQGVLEPDFCRSILPPKVYDRWGKALSEYQKFNCPFNDCSALLPEGVDGISKSECPHCNRLFCAQCKVPWHAGITCVEFQKLDVDERGREDIMLMEAAKTNKWQRCSKCKFYVERTEGCSFMRCRCGHAFCHSCGRTLMNNYCKVCIRYY